MCENSRQAEATARFQHATEFPQRLVDLHDIADAEGDGDRVGGAIRKGSRAASRATRGMFLSVGLMPATSIASLMSETTVKVRVANCDGGRLR